MQLLPRPYRIGHEMALAGLGECKEVRVEQIGANVHGPAVTEVEYAVLRRTVVISDVPSMTHMTTL